MLSDVRSGGLPPASPLRVCRERLWPIFGRPATVAAKASSIRPRWAWDHSVFSKNRDRLLEGDIAAKLLAAVLAQPQVKRLLSTDHFSVDGTLIEAWCSMKSFRPKDEGGGDGPPSDGPGGRNAEVDFRGEKRSNATHASTTDPDALLYRKSPGAGAKLCYMGHVLMENRNGLVVDAETTRVSGYAERLAALEMIDGIVDPDGSRRITI